MGIFTDGTFCSLGTYCSDALEKRTPFREEHLARLQSLKQQGTLITLGPTGGKYPRVWDL